MNDTDWEGLARAVRLERAFTKWDAAGRLLAGAFEDLAVKNVCGDEHLPLGPDRPWDANAAHARLLEWATDGGRQFGAEAQRRFASTHLWCAAGPDADGNGLADDITDYKLPFCDIVDGRPMAMPQALRAVLARVGQTDGIPVSAQREIARKAKAYLAKAGGQQEHDQGGQGDGAGAPKGYDSLTTLGFLIPPVLGEVSERKALATARDALELKAVDDSTIKGYACVYGNEDLGHDIIVPGACKQTLAEARDFATAHRTTALWPLLYQHDQKDPVGAVMDARETAKGLHCTFKVDTSTDHGRAAFNGLRDGYMSFSIGYKPLDYGWQGRTRLLKQIGLGEVSAVTFPMNREARPDAPETNNNW